MGFQRVKERLSLNWNLKFKPTELEIDTINNNIKKRLSMGQLEHQKYLYDRAFEFIRAGLDRENSDKLLALDYYLKGLADLNEALNLKFTSQDWPRAKCLHEKMIKHKDTIEKRVKDISNRNMDTIGFQQPTRSLKPKKHISSPPTYAPNAIPNNNNGIASSVSPTQQAPRSPPSGSSSTSASKPKAALNSLQVDPKLANLILNDVLVDKPNVSWDDISGLEQVKATLRETVILPALKPELFTGLRTPPRGILLFGPPGTGKTLLAKALAFEAKCTFFSISASSLMSKYMGESEKLVRTLFALAKELSPSIIFIDEIDSILKGRTDSEHEGSRRLKTEFLLQFDGVNSQSDTKRVLVMGATNRPQELDEAARRRFVKRVYIPLPDASTREQLVAKSLKGTLHSLTASQTDTLVRATDGYSGSDLTALIKDAAMGPLRQLGDGGQFLNATVDSIPPITMEDFENSLKMIRKSVGVESLREYQSWNEEYGSVGV